MAAVVIGGLGVQAVAALAMPPSSYESRTSSKQTPAEQRGRATVLRYLHISPTTGYPINLATRAVVFSSTGLLALWFVVGGIPRRRNAPLVSLSPISERTRVLPTPRLQRRNSKSFLRGYEAEGAEHTIETKAAVESPAALGTYAPPAITSSTATILELMSDSGQPKLLNDADRTILQAMDTAITRETDMDDLILSEVEEYARTLLARGSSCEVGQTAGGSEAAVFTNAEPEPEPILAAPPEAAVEQITEPIPAESPELTMATQPRRIEEEDVLGLSELTGSMSNTDQRFAIDELFNAVSTVETAADAHVDPYDLLQCEIAPEPERPYSAQDIATILKPEMIGSTLLTAAATRSTPQTVAAHETEPLFDQRIIIIGDSEAVLEVEKRIVISAGARVITFERFTDAVNFADEKDFDLMVVNGMTEDGFSATKVYDWLSANRPGWEKRSAFALSAPDPASDDFAARTGAWCIVHPFGPKELVSFLRAVVMSTQLSPM